MQNVPIMYVYVLHFAGHKKMVGKLDLKTIVSVFDSHWVPHSSGLVPQLS